MINNIVNNVDARPQMGVNKATTSRVSSPIPPLIGFKTPKQRGKAELRVKKFKKSDNIIIAGEIDDDYVDIVEQEIIQSTYGNFFQQNSSTKKQYKVLKECYVIDYIQSPIVKCGMGTEAIKGLVEKAMFDPKIQGRIVTYSAPVMQEMSPALFFYKIGFRFIEQAGNERMEQCIIQRVTDIPPQIGMMYLPKKHIHKLLRYGELF